MNLFNSIKSVMPFISKRMVIMASLIVSIMSSSFVAGNAGAGDIRVITNINEWHHPVKDVLIKHKVILYKVELYNKTYPVFYVKFPYDPHFAHNDNYFKPLYYETLKANGFWDYSFIDRDFQCKINIKWDKNTKTLTEGVEDFK
jgi:hypothetical protein